MARTERMSARRERSTAGTFFMLPGAGRKGAGAVAVGAVEEEVPLVVEPVGRSGAVGGLLPVSWEAAAMLAALARSAAFEMMPFEDEDGPAPAPAPASDLAASPAAGVAVPGVGATELSPFFLSSALNLLTSLSTLSSSLAALACSSFDPQEK